MHLKDPDDGNGYVLSTGRKVSANHGLIGIAQHTVEHLDQMAARLEEDGEGLGLFEISEGFDGHLYDLAEWTRAELIELADFMIAQWQAFREHVNHATI